MNVKWLLESEVFVENLDPLRESIKNQGMEYSVCRYVPFEGSDQFLNLFDKNDCVVFYGSIQFAQQVKRCAPWIPGVYCNAPQFECLYYYPRFGDCLLNHDYVMLPFGELNRRKDFLLSTLSEDSCLFIRPSSGLKLFTGKVVCEETWDKDIDLLGFYDVTPESLVVVARPQTIIKEWRLVIIDGKVVAGSQYKPDLTKEDLQIVSEFAEQLLSKINYNPDPVWTLDVCQTKDQCYHVLEVGSFSCAGLYACDMSRIVEAVSKKALSEWQDLQN